MYVSFENPPEPTKAASLKPATTSSHLISPPLLPPPPPLLCPKGFIFEPGYENSKTSKLRDSWDFTTMNQCTVECKKRSNCKAILWSRKYWHCILLRRTSAFPERFEDYVKCAGTTANDFLTTHNDSKS